MHGTWKKPQGRRKIAAATGMALLIGIGSTLATTSRQPTAAADQITAKLRLPVGTEADPSRVDYRRLDQRIALVMQEPNMVGLAVAAVERGRLRFIRGYGETLAGSGEPVTPDTVFRWASLSKGVASALVTRLADEGRLSLDAPLSGMGTTLTLPGDTKNATVADLLSHRLGLVRNAWDDRLEAGADPKVIRAELGTLAPFCPPGTCYAYQNIAYDAAAEIVERTTGQDYATAARDRLFSPLGMKNASVGRIGLESAARWAKPHRMGRQPAMVNDYYYRVPAAGGVNSPVRDLTRWMLAQMGAAPTVLPAETLSLMHQPRVPTPPHGRRGAMDRALTDAAYGLGWRTFHYAGHALVGHRGSVDGYGSLILFDPADRSGIVMLWNSNRHVAARLQLEFFDMLYGLAPTNWLELPAPGAGATGTDTNRSPTWIKASHQ
ncbi:serine hydrolase domain-containing protein [Sphingomonas mucosissima]|uniref:D-alanyl-D-alanine carboxypeptidase n=1 Tax=Sphingomonas mucosissima TaxID=370959 RepID=A0A245ZIL7_9SPHN|nr:serine hydrolase domain-containing protein [Sphingomonas mucosissima]OWK29588.1 D-alanyl-D-alanine carboxypeptidase precursor [Sphingomonas mucosissima]